MKIMEGKYCHGCEFFKFGTPTQVKDMLAKCSPYIIKFISNDGISIFVECEFCGADGYNCIDTHKPDCKYINMIGGVE